MASRFIAEEIKGSCYKIENGVKTIGGSNIFFESKVEHNQRVLAPTSFPEEKRKLLQMFKHMGENKNIKKTIVQLPGSLPAAREGCGDRSGRYRDERYAARRWRTPTAGAATCGQAPALLTP